MFDTLKKALRLAGAVHELETKMAQLEERDLGARVDQLNALEKVMRRLNAREDRRVERAEPRQDAPEPSNGEEPVVQTPPHTSPSTAHLAKRFRGW